MTAVRTTTDEFPALADFLATRHELGLDTYDEWWDGEYRTVTGPTPEHGELLTSLAALFQPLVRERGLRQAAPVNIGTDKRDCRVPDLGVYEADTQRTSTAFLSTARLVVEVLSKGEPAGAKLDFYRSWGIEEYLEIDLAAGTVRLLRSTDGWEPASMSAVLGFSIDGSRLVAADGSTVDVADFRP